MRKIERELIAAIRSGRSFSKSNTHFDGKYVTLYRSKIAEYDGTKLVAINFCGWDTRTTRSRIKELLFEDGRFTPAQIHQFIELCPKHEWVKLEN